MNSVVVGQNNNSVSWVDSLSSWINPYHNLEQRIQKIANNNQLLAQDKKDLDITFQLAKGWIWPAGRMKHLIQTMPKKHIQELLEELLINGKEKEIPVKLNSYLNLLNQATLLDLSDLKTTIKAQSWFHSRGLIKNSILTSNIERAGRAIFKEFLIDAKHFFHHILDVFIAILGLNEIGAARHSRYSSYDDRIDEYSALHKLETYMKLIGYPAALFGMIYTYVQFKAFAISLTALSLSALSLTLIAYPRYWKPCPKDHFGLKNLNLEILKPHDPTYVRQDILRSIERAFKEKKGVILVGEPGAGKSSIPRSLAQQIAEGKSCTFINNPEFFSCGASKFNSHSFESPSFDSISERFKNHKEKVIFFFDEFHAFFKKEGLEGRNKVDDVKMFCEDFKFVIGATTTEEFEKHIRNQTAIIDRRFTVINVGKLEDKTIKIILSQYLQAKHPTINLDVKAIDYIVKNAKTFNPKTSKIDAAQTLLNRAIKEMDTVEFESLEMNIKNLETEKKLLEQELIHAKIGKEEDLTQKLESNQLKIDKLKLELEKKHQLVERVRKIETFYLKLKEQSFRMADSEVKLTAHPSLNRGWIELQAKIKIVGDFIENERLKLSLPTCLDCNLIDKINPSQNLRSRKLSARRI